MSDTKKMIDYRVDTSLDNCKLEGSGSVMKGMIKRSEKAEARSALLEKINKHVIFSIFCRKFQRYCVAICTKMIDTKICR